MGATRLALTMGVVGLAAGAVLAMATVPSLRSYEDGNSRPLVKHDGGERAADDSWRIAAGPRDGTIVVGVPSWAESTAEWFAFGQRALATWRIWSEPEDSPASTGGTGTWETRLAERHERARYAAREEGSEDEPYAAAADDVRPSPAGADPLARVVDDAAAEAAARALDAAKDVLAIEIEP